MKTVRGEHLTFAKSQLASLCDGQLKCLYVFAHILNRLKLLEGQTFSHWNVFLSEEETTIKREAAQHGVVEFVLLLAAELKEAWESIQLCYFRTHLSKTLNQKLPKSAQEALKRIPVHCQGDIYKLRNNFSYHHSPDEILASAKELVADDPHNAFLGEGDNNFFGFSSDLRILAISRLLNVSNPSALLDHLVKVVVRDTYADVSEALTAILGEIFSKVEMGGADTEIPDIQSTDELRAEYFFHAQADS